MFPKTKTSKGASAPYPSFNRSPIPNEMFVTLRYVDTWSSNASTGAAAWDLTTNGLFDPDITFVGSQPLSFDQWTAMYQRYLVLESCITVTLTSRAVSNSARATVVPVALSTSLPGDWATASEMRLAKTGTTTGGAEPVKIVNTVRTDKLFGVPLVAVQSDDNFAATFAANPNRLGVWSIRVETSGASDAFSLDIVVCYKARFWMPNLASVSLLKRPKEKIRKVPSMERGGPVVGPLPGSTLDGLSELRALRENLSRLAAAVDAVAVSSGESHSL